MDYTFTLEAPALELELKKLIVQETEKDEFDPAEIRDDEWLFGEQSRIQLDSLDALQIVVALQAHFGVRLQGDRMVRKHMMNIRDLAAFIREQHSKT
jgi:acyl-carrier protein